MLGLGLGIAYGQLRPLSRYSIDGKAPAVIADYSAGVYGLDGAHVAFGYLLTFTGPAGRTYTNADGDLVTVGLNEPRLGNHIDTGSGLFDTGLLMESEERTNLYPNTHTLNPSSTPSGGTGASPVYNIYPQNSVQTLPDGATGADDGVGFTCTGIASDGDGGFWVGNLGRPSQSSVDPAEPQLVRVNSDASAIMSAIPTSFQMQGVAKRNDVLYYVRQTAGVYHIDTDGSGEALAFAVTGANGIAYDQTRDRFWLSVGTVISLRTIDGSVDASFDIGGETIDHLYHDPIRDVLWVSSGANNAIANIRIVQPDGTVLKAMSLEDGYAVEGIVVEGNEVVCVYDGFFHAPDGVPVPNQLNTLKKHKVVFGPSGMPADYVQFDKGAGTSSGDYSILQLPGLTVASGRYTQSVYTMNDEEGDVDVSFRITSDGYETKTVGDEWSRISYTTAADQTVLATQILLRGTYGTSETASLWFDIMQVEAGQVATSPIITTGSSVTLAGETLQIDAAVLQTALGATMPAAVSAAMDTFITYADLDTADQLTLYDHRVDANNRMTVTVSTDGANTGLFTFTMVNGGSSASVSAPVEISPGTNIAASVAWYADAAGINIAVNGTAATEVATAIGVPDLIAADADIATDFNGNIPLQRIWAENVGDDNLAALTE